MLLWSLKLLLFVISLSGYVYLWSYKDKKIKFEFIPILVISVVSNVLLLSAYVGMLKPFSIAIYIGGFVSLFFVLYQKKDIIKTNYSYLFFIMGVIAIAVLVYGRLFNEHDSYSHYGIMVKRMLLHDGLPDANDSVIIFKSYPAAMSCFMYMSCLFNDGSDWTMTATQGMVLVACVYTLVTLIKNNKIISYIFVTLVGYGMVFYCNYITSLMLDTIIPLLGGVAFLLFFIYRENIADYLFYIAIILSFCVLTKNSGFAFVASLAIVVVIFASKGRLKTILFTAVIPAVMYFLWTIHVRIAFPGGMESNHAMSVEHYADVYSTRSEEMIRAIFASFYDRMFNRPNQGFFVLNMFAVTMLIIYISKQQKIKETIHVVTSVFLTYIIWIAGTLGMYIFSMEDTKASLLDCFERYRSTGEMFCMFIISYIVIKQLTILQPYKYVQAIKEIHITILPTKKTTDKKSKNNKELFIPLFTFIMLLVSITPLWTNRHIGERSGISTEYREKISDIVDDRNLKADLTYLIYCEDDFNYKVIDGNMLSPFRPFFTVQYELNSRKIVFANNDTMEDALQLYDYDVILFLKDDDIANTYKKDNGYNVTDKIIFKE